MPDKNFHFAGMLESGQSEPEKNPGGRGHRQRLRDRFLRDMGASMPDYELLELLLTQALPRRDVKPIAKELMAEFGSFANVVSADPRQLEAIKDVKSSAITSLKLVQAAALRLSQQQIMNTHILSSWDKLIDYCQAAMGHEKIEQVRLLFLDNKNRLIADEAHQRGTVNHTPLYPREVIKRALELNASAMILVHNHPSGDPTPSGDDIQMTYEVRDAAKKLGITLHDHLIISKGGHTSFKSSGLL